MTRNTDVPDSVCAPLTEVFKQDWYANPSDHRCPHDGWLRRFDFHVHGNSANLYECRPSLELEILTAYHTGTITFIYEGVFKYDAPLIAEGGGEYLRRSDWIEDSVTQVGESHVRHEITWEAGKWTIEAESVLYAWRPGTSADDSATKTR